MPALSSNCSRRSPSWPRTVTFTAEVQSDRRYFTNNPSYGVGDALIAIAPEELKSARYLEVGSGWTTALALDTKDLWLDGRLRITCIVRFQMPSRP
jgi:hypothetical protein